MLCRAGVNQREHGAHHSPLPLAGDFSPARRVACCFAILVIDVDEVNIAGDVEFARTQFSMPTMHSSARVALGPQGCTVGCIQLDAASAKAVSNANSANVFAPLSPQARCLFAIKAHQPFDDQLAPQGCAGRHSGRTQIRIKRCNRGVRWRARWGAEPNCVA